MRLLGISLTLIVLLACPAVLRAQECDRLDPRGQVSETTTQDIVGSAQTLFKVGRLEGSYKSAAETEVKNLYDKYPNQDKIVLRDKLIYLFCTILETSDLSSWEKIEQFNIFQNQIMEIPIDPLPPPPPPPPPPEQCKPPWQWDTDSQSCVRKSTVPPKTFSIPLERSIRKVVGRIDFYTNTERLPGADSHGIAMYSENNGALQVVISVMLGDTMVGNQREVIYSTNEGVICRVSSLPETTDHLKKMRVRYSLGLDTDCKGAGHFCQARIVQSGKRVQVTISALRVTIGNRCF